MPKLTVNSRCSATLELEAHDVWFIGAMLEQFNQMRQVGDAQEALGTTEFENDFIDDCAEELAQMMSEYDNGA